MGTRRGVPGHHALLQRVRDEAHRFAITYHRQKRSQGFTSSALEDIAGLGPARRAALLKQFGSVRKLTAATPEQIAEVPGIGPRLAETIVAALHRDTSPEASPVASPGTSRPEEAR